MNLTIEEIEGLDFCRVGTNVTIHRTAIVIHPEKISIGNNFRLDCFSILSAGNDGITMGEHVHIAAGVYLYGSGGHITIEDFGGISSRCVIYTASDDFVDGYLTGPTIPDKYRKLRVGNVTIGRHAVLGAGVIVLPMVTIGTGATVGAMSLIRKDVPEWHVVAGNPPRIVALRNRSKVLSLERELFLEERGIMNQTVV